MTTAQHAEISEPRGDVFSGPLWAGKQIRAIFYGFFLKAWGVPPRWESLCMGMVFAVQRMLGAIHPVMWMRTGEDLALLWSQQYTGYVTAKVGSPVGCSYWAACTRETAATAPGRKRWEQDEPCSLENNETSYTYVVCGSLPENRDFL